MTDTPADDAADGGDDGSDDADGTDSTTDAASAVPARQVVAEELAPARDLLSRASAFVGLPEPRVLAADVRSLPPHERFERAARRHVDRLDVDVLDADAGALDADAVADAAADLPVAEPIERATTFLVRRSGRLQGRLLAQLASDPDHPRNLLVLAVAAGHLQRAAADLQHATETDDGDIEHLASVVLALVATLFSVAGDGLDAPADRDPAAAARDEPLPDDVYRDVALAEHHRALASDDAVGTDPLERDVADLKHLLVVQGATLAVTELDADPQAVAALADVPLEHVIGVLATD